MWKETAYKDKIETEIFKTPVSHEAYQYIWLKITQTRMFFIERTFNSFPSKSTQTFKVTNDNVFISNDSCHWSKSMTVLSNQSNENIDSYLNENFVFGPLPVIKNFLDLFLKVE